MLTSALGFGSDIFVAIYGAPLVSFLCEGWSRDFCSTSFWCKRVFLLGLEKDDILDWFVDVILRKVGSSIQTFFLEGPSVRFYFLKG